MENEEKKGCCEGKENCAHGMHGCCHNWKKCHIMKKVIMIVVIIIAFCLGSQWGEMKSEWRGNRFERGGMMNWGGGRYDNFYSGASQKSTGEVTVKVSDTPPITGTTPITPKQ